jgi:hypothetical protein
MAVCLASACAATSPEENFKQAMQGEIGKNADAPNAYTTYYGWRRLSVRQLPNGNIEEEYPEGRGYGCPVFFEIEKQSRIIVGWRAHGKPEDCVRVR